MMKTVEFAGTSYDDFMSWLTGDKKIFNKINTLIQEIRRTPFTGTGKPEPLRGNLSGFWSRRIDSRHRLVYTVKNDTLIIISCYGHYEK